MIDKTIQNWSIESKISTGAFAEVYKVKNACSGAYGALKIFNKTHCDENSRIRFKRSFLASSKILHENCVQMIDWIEDKGTVGFVMEYVDGESLADLLDKKCLDRNQSLNLITQICRGLNALHSAGIVHRDLKPQNILVGREEKIKITDFDLMKIEDSAEMTIEGTFLGSVRFCSPEQCAGASSVDQRSDLYSLGVIFYRMMTGILPFDGKNFTEIALSHLNGSFERPSVIIPEIPGILESIIEKLLRKNPRERYNSAYEVLKEICRYSKVVYDGKQEQGVDKNIFKVISFGREDELNSLKNSLENSMKGTFSMNLISGGRGSGKSKLKEDFKLMLDIGQIPVIELELKSISPTNEVLKKLMIKILDSLKFISDIKKATLIGSLTWDLIGVLPELKDADFTGLISNIPTVTEDESEVKLFEAVSNFIGNFAKIPFKGHLKYADSVIVVIFENVHCADSSFFRWLSFSAKRLQNKKVLFLITADESKLDGRTVSAFSDLKKLPSFNEIPLKPLNWDQIKKILETSFSGTIPEEIIDAFFRKTKGNPSLINELVKYVFLEEGVKIVGKTPVFDINVIERFTSELLRNAVFEKIAGTDEKDLGILEYAAVLGEAFSIEDIVKISGENETDIINALETAKTKEIVGFDSGNSMYYFIEDKISDSIVKNMTEDRNKSVHAAVAMYFKCKTPNEKNNSSAARHFFASEKYKQAKEHSLKAGEEALKNFNTVGADTNFSILLDIAEKDGDLSLQSFVHEKLGDSAFIAGEKKRAEHHYRKALEVAESARIEKIGGSLYLKTGKTYSDLGKYELAESCLIKALEFFEKEKNPEKTADVFGEIGRLKEMAFKYDEAQKYYSNQLDQAGQSGNEMLVSNAYSNLGKVSNSLGKFDEALKYFRKSLELNKKASDTRKISENLLNIGDVYVYKGAEKESSKYYEQFIEACDDMDNKLGKVIGMISIGDIYFKNGKYEKAEESYLKAYSIAKDINRKNYLFISYTKAGDCRIFMKDTEGSINYYAEAFEQAGEQKQKIACLNVLSHLNLVRKNYDEAKKQFSLTAEIACNEPDGAEIVFFTGIGKAVSLLLSGNKDKWNDEMASLLKLADEKNINYGIKVINLLKDVAENKNTKNIDSLFEDIKDFIPEKNIVLFQLYIYLIFRHKHGSIIAFQSLYKTTNETAMSEVKKLNNLQRIFLNLLEEDSFDVKKTSRISIDDTALSMNELVLANVILKFLSPETAFKEFLKYLKTAKNADSAVMLTKCDDKQTPFSGVCEYGDENIEVSGYRIKAIYPGMDEEELDFSKTVLRKVIANQDILLIENAVENPDFKNNPSIFSKPFLSVLAIPIKFKDGEFYGAIYLDRRDFSKKPFTLHDAEIAEKIAKMLAPVLEKHYEDEKARRSSEVIKMGLFVGQSPAMMKLYSEIEKCAKLDMIVFIQGETGAGKELVARALYKLSDRKDKPFIAVNCAAIAPTLAESELFGHEKGAFSGASEMKKGKFELAGEGVLFLDEIAELPLDMQAKMLRVLQYKEIWRVGGQSSKKVEARVIVSTHKYLEQEVENGNFRADLYHRLDVLKITVPPLRERKKDVIPLAYHFLNKFTESSSVKIKGFTGGAERKLLEYDWPGNIRELENIIAKSSVYHHGDGPVEENEILIESKKVNKAMSRKMVLSTEISGFSSLQQAVEKVECEMVKKSLQKNDWNISKTAQELKISRVKLYKIIEQHRLKK